MRYPFKYIHIPKQCIEAAGDDELIAYILMKRGIDTPEKIRGFLYQDKYKPFDPANLIGSREGIEIIKSHMNNKSKVCIYGDYDVDGITSTVILKEALTPLMGKVIYHIPDRFSEGYGMNLDVVKDLKQKGVNLIITCDCGISNHEEVELVKSFGMDIIITDHHTLPDSLPSADAIINPKLYNEDHPLYYLPGVAVVYLFVLALYNIMGIKIGKGRWMDLVALGIVADVVPIHRENRYLLKRGLPYLIEPDRVGLQALFQLLKKTGYSIVDEEDIAFQISPRINAAGRMGCADLPVKLLLEEDIEDADLMAKQLDKLNTERKTLQNRIFQRAKKRVEKDQLDKGILVLYDPSWHEGVLGIVAGKLAETYKSPAICLSLKPDKKTVSGSARSVGDVSIYDLLEKSKKFLQKFGGHSQAAGMSLDIDSVDDFKSCIQNLLPLSKGVSERLVDIDVVIDISHVNDSLLKRVEKMAPFGHGFERPVFSSEDVDIISNSPIGKGHRRFLFSAGEHRVGGIWWWALPIADRIQEKGHIIYNLGRDNRRLSLNILDMGEGSKRFSKCIRLGYDIAWRDFRGKSSRDILNKFSTGQIYHEGVGEKIQGARVRYDIDVDNRLILLTMPPTPCIFRELVIGSGAREVVLGFQDESTQSLNSILKILQSMLKHIIKEQDGVVNIRELAVALKVAEEFVEICLEYLKERGAIDYTWEEKGMIFIFKGEERGLGKGPELMLRNAFTEMRAFKRYMYKSSPETLSKLISAQ